MLVIIIWGAVVGKLTEKGSKFESFVGVEVLLYGKGDFEDGLPCTPERGKTLAEAAWAGEKIYNWNRHRGGG
jgi:hypothetical protein